MSQSVLDTLITFAAMLPVAIDVFLVYRLFRFFPFTSAILFGLAPYLALAFSRGLPVPVAIVAALATAVTLSAAVGFFLTWLLRVRQSSPLQLFLLSLGLVVVAQNAVSLVFGSQPMPLPAFAARPIAVAGLGTVGPARLAMLAWAGVTLGSLALILWKSRLGLEWRALANDRELSEILGLLPRRAMIAAFCLGALFTAGAGILQAADTAMSPMMGLRAFMIAAVAVVVGGQRLPAVLGAALAVALAQNCGALAFGGRWQDAVVFAVLLLFLLARPRGLAAAAERTA
jgi:branched-chain amino acid transport system permease protein